jgi:hypothetical protein
MSTQDADASAAVVAALKDSLDGVTMHTPVEQIVTTGGARVARRRRRRLMSAATGVAAAAGLTLAVPALNHPPTAPSEAAVSTGPGSVHIRTVAFTLDSRADGTIHVTWDKQRYFQDRDGLQRALRAAGFPVLIKEGVFCKGPLDDGYLDPSGVGRGVHRVMKAQQRRDDTVVFVFNPAAMPAGKQLFIGYLSSSQLAVTHGAPGSVERLVPATGPLTCTTQAPPPRYQDNGPVEKDGPAKVS